MVISITDNGTGMSDEVRKKIFDPFFTTKPAGHGTGLGLAISYSILSAHDASVTVDSVEGEGSVFTIKLPIEAQADLTELEFQETVAL